MNSRDPKDKIDLVYLKQVINDNPDNRLEFENCGPHGKTLVAIGIENEYHVKNGNLTVYENEDNSTLDGKILFDSHYDIDEKAIERANEYEKDFIYCHVKRLLFGNVKPKK